jgi:hypothetical protein
MIEIICEKKEFVANLKGGIPKSRWNEFINCTQIIRNIKVVSSYKSKNKQTKLTQLITIHAVEQLLLVVSC